MLKEGGYSVESGLGIELVTNFMLKYLSTSCMSKRGDGGAKGGNSY